MSALIARTPRRPTAPSAKPGCGRPLQAAGRGAAQGDAGRVVLALPFNALRFQYASAVMAGLVPRSLLGSARAERAIDRLERLILGPMARLR